MKSFQNGNHHVVAPERKAISGWPFKESYDFLSSYLSSCSFDQRINKELPAIITHWIHNPSVDPLFFERGTGKKWRTLLSKFYEDNFKCFNFSGYPLAQPKTTHFTFIDLFAGIGGFRIALQEQHGKCVFSSEWDAKAKETYFQNYAEYPFGDIKTFTEENISDDVVDKTIPDHDILAAGFPCQPFSLAGVSARNSLGRKHGFLCKVQGTLFFDIVRIASIKRPKVLFLENVRNLISHDKGNTFLLIKDTIENLLGYSFHFAEIDSSTLVPQRRKRIFMVCFRDKAIGYSFPSFSGTPRPLSDILEPRPDPKYTLSKRMWEGHVRRTKRNLNRGTGFTAFIADISKPSNTLVARYYKDGKECLIPTKSGLPRMLTVKEAALLQGYKAPFKPHPSRSCAYKQFGNSVTVPVVSKIASSITKYL